MDIIFHREYTDFLSTLRLYIQNKTTYASLCKSHNRYIASTFPNTDTLTVNLDQMRHYIHTYKLTEYIKAMEFEKKLKELKEEHCEWNDEMVGKYQGITKMDDVLDGLTMYPMMDMLEFGDDEEEKILAKKDDVGFEF